MKKNGILIVLILVVSGIQIVLSQNLNSGLIAHYNFDGNINDQSGNGNHCTLGGGSISYANDHNNIANGSIYFNGGSFITAPNSTSLRTPENSGQISLVMWVNTTKDDMPILAKSNSSDYGMYNYHCQRWSMGIVYLSGKGMTSNIDASNQISANRWHHIAIITDQNTTKLFIDGIYFAQRNMINSGTGGYGSTPNLPLEIGRHTPGLTEYFQGWIDDLRLYNRAITAQEIAILAGTGCPSDPLNQGLVAYYPLDGNTYDYSGNGNHGNENGITTYVSNRHNLLNKAIMFNNSYIKVQNSNSLKFNSELTISFWYKGLLNNYYATLLGKEGDRGGFYCHISGQSNLHTNIFVNNLSFTNNNINGTTQTKNLTSQWNNMTVVVSQSNTKVFVNNKLEYSINKPPDFTVANNGDLYIGTMWALNSSFYMFNGMLDDIRIYNRALTDEEVMQLYGSNSEVCATGDLQLYAPSSANSYVWSGPNGFASTMQYPTKNNVFVSDSGTYRVLAKYGGCTDTFYSKVNVNNCNLTTGLVAHYPLDGDITDISGNNNNGTYFNGLAYGKDRFGYCYKSATFDGIDDYASVPNNPKINEANSRFTHTAWVKGGNSGNLVSILCKVIPTTLDCQFRYYIDIPNKNLIFGRNINATAEYFFTIPNTYNLLNWNLYSITYDGYNLKAYINGVQIGSTIKKVEPILEISSAPLEIGRDAHGPIEYLNGTIDDIRIYNRVLSSYELDSLYKKTEPMSEKAPALVLTPPKSTSICQGDSVTIKVSNTPLVGVNYLWYKNGSIINGYNRDTLRTNQSGTYAIRAYKNNQTACDTTITYTLNLTINAIPNVPAVSNVALCQYSSSIPLSGSGTNLKWYLSPSGGQALNSIIPSTNSIGTFDYYVTQTNSAGCESPRVKQQVIINSLPNTQISSNNNIKNICIGDSVLLTASPNSNSYQWNTGSNQQKIYVKAGYYSLTVTDPKGCKKETSIEIKNHPTPKLSFISEQTICKGKSTAIEASGGVSYIWDQGLGSGSIKTVSPLQKTTYTVTMTDANGCKVSGSTIVDVNPLPTINVTAPQNICFGDTATISCTNGYKSYLWNTQSTSNSLIIPVNFMNAQSYTVTVTDQMGCSNTSSTIITSSPLPSFNKSANISTCPFTSIDLSVTSSPYYSYKWENGETSNNNNIISGDQNKFYLVTVSNINSNCKKIDSILVNILEKPEVMLTSDNFNNTYCEGATVILTASPNIKTYVWSGPNNYSNSNSNIAKIANLTKNNSGNYQVIVQNDKSCLDTAIIQINVIESPAAKLEGDDVLCSSDKGTLYKISNLLPQYRFKWSLDSDSVKTEKLLYNLSNGTILSVKVVDTNTGCEKTIEKKIIVNTTPKLKMSSISKQKICKDSSTILLVDGAVQYFWNDGNIQNQKIVSPLESTIYSVVGLTNNCYSDTLFWKVDVIKREQAKGYASDYICKEPIQLFGENRFGYTGEWIAINSNQKLKSIDTLNAIVTNFNSGTNKFVWKIYSSECQYYSSDTLEVIYHNELPIAVKDTQLIEPLKEIEINLLSNDTIPKNLIYGLELIEQKGGEWKLDTNGILSFISELYFGGYALGKYKIWNKWCPEFFTEANIRILVNAPKLGADDGELITPNGDGKNEGLEFEYLPLYPENEIVIFNRWGSEVYRAKPYKNAEAWSGKGKNGGDLPDGTYYYFLILESKTEGRKSVYGSVLLIR